MKLYQIDAKLSFTEPDAPQPEASVPCDGCPAPCCTTPNWTVFLTFEEAKRLPYTFADVTFPGGQVVPFAAVLPRHPVTGACVFAVGGRCTVWALRPRACRAYECRTDRAPAMMKFAKERFTEGESIMTVPLRHGPAIDFVKVAKLLRAHLAAHPPIIVGKEDGHLQLHPESRIARDALTKVEGELAAQSVLYLYDHLTAHEQWAKAAALVAHCLPFSVLDRPDVRDLLARASGLADKVETPVAELAHYLRSDFVHRLPDWMADPSKTTPRAAYWMSVTRLREARVSMEWGCGAGVHVMQAAQLYRDVEWWGIDAKADQIKVAREQALRIASMAKFASDQGSAFGVDVVAVLDTLEHTVHPVPMLDKAERYVASGGVMVVTVPNGPWSLHTAAELDDARTVPGNHVNVQHAREFIPFIESRGFILDARAIPGPYMEAEGNSTLAVTYRPKGAR